MDSQKKLCKVVVLSLIFLDEFKGIFLDVLNAFCLKMKWFNRSCIVNSVVFVTAFCTIFRIDDQVLGEEIKAVF
jgi:hypothetical protein